MLFHIPRLIQRFEHRYKSALTMMGGQVLSRFGASIIYAILPVVLAGMYSEWFAGLAFGCMNLFQAFGANPVTGSLADRIGSRPVIMGAGIFGVIVSAIWFFGSLENPLILFPFLALFATYYSCRDTTTTYLLRTTPKNAGGLIFGLSENIFSAAYFLATLAMPFFIIAGHQQIAALIFGVGAVIDLATAWRLPNDTPRNAKKPTKESWGSLFNPFALVHHGWHFVRTNHYYPLLALGNTLFEGIFYGTIWFLFPLHLAALGTGGAEDGLQLGIYELITMLFAGAVGYLADRFNWRFIHAGGWALIIVGLLALPFFLTPFALIAVGTIIAVGNNLGVFSAEHALEYYDIDHREDGSFTALRSLVSDIGWAVMPVIMGFAYAAYGFTAALLGVGIVCSVIGLGLIYLTWALRGRDVPTTKPTAVINTVEA